ncbi:MAG: hypothetical protein AAF242_12070 [Bacteroidota bacterium]
MKIRILNDSIRLRLSQTEVNTLVDQGIVRASTRFGAVEAAVFSYQIKIEEKVDLLSANYAADLMTIFINKNIVQAWAADDTHISLKSAMPVGEGQTLSLLVEKDFKCLSPTRTEDESDLFPHPKEESINC